MHETRAYAIVFTVAASSTVLLPLLLTLWLPRTASRGLIRLRRWLTARNAVITAVVLGVLGIAVITSGISLL
ncbi:GAP family protein [Microbacterium sp. Root1433D1]|uniref:GAP family protein n=1 Tax=Microbacterium sp. Root1433D1 TaxID=1736463 RepID=UPI0009EC1582